MAHPSYPPEAQSGYPPVAQPAAPQSSYPSAPPAGYPPVAQPPAPQSSDPSSQPAGYSPVSQPNYTPQPSYPPIPEPHQTSMPPSGYPAMPQANYAPPPHPVPQPSPSPSQTAITNPLPVLGPHYCLPHPVDLAVTGKRMTLTDDFVVTDINQTVIFKVKGKFLSLHGKRVLLDAAGNPVVTLRQKILTAHSRWHVFRGDSSDSKDLLFTVKTSSAIQLKTKLNVYLAHRTSEDVCDFKVHGSWSERSCVIYVGESNTIAAQMHKKETAQSYFLGKDTFMVTVYPNADYAFIVALIVILDAINTEDDV